ncbi:MAG: acyltransferase [Candidatus Hydrogenedentes bacterium]|nr:acyltransferase [Candidatus Hydrogenedentota bacterium]
MTFLHDIKRRVLRLTGYYFPRAIGSAGNGTKIAWPRRIVNPYRVFLGAETFIHRGVEIQAIEKVGSQRFEPKITIGDRVYVGQNAFIASINEVDIEHGCVLSDYVYISDSAHGLNPLAGAILKQPWESLGPVKIGRGCFIGYRAMIMPGVTLGAHCVVGAGAVVTKSFPDFMMVAGVPAKAIKRFCLERKVWRSVEEGA